jgi:hypothetical protein
MYLPSTCSSCWLSRQCCGSASAISYYPSRRLAAAIGPTFGIALVAFSEEVVTGNSSVGSASITGARISQFFRNVVLNLVKEK